MLKAERAFWGIATLTHVTPTRSTSSFPFFCTELWRIRGSLCDVGFDADFPLRFGRGTHNQHEVRRYGRFSLGHLGKRDSDSKKQTQSVFISVHYWMWTQNFGTHTRCSDHEYNRKIVTQILLWTEMCPQEIAFHVSPVIFRCRSCFCGAIHELIRLLSQWVCCEYALFTSSELALVKTTDSFLGKCHHFPWNPGDTISKYSLTLFFLNSDVSVDQPCNLRQKFRVEENIRCRQHTGQSEFFQKSAKDALNFAPVQLFTETKRKLVLTWSVFLSSWVRVPKHSHPAQGLPGRWGSLLLEGTNPQTNLRTKHCHKSNAERTNHTVEVSACFEGWLGMVSGTLRIIHSEILILKS